MTRPPLPEEVFRLERQQELATDVEPFGHDLAERVASGLQAGWVLAYSHRDYCGMGLYWQDGRFCYAEIYDGRPDEPALRVFDERDAFVEWFASQSSASLARLDDPKPFFRGNQVIARWRVLEFVKQADAGPPAYPQLPPD